MLFEGDYHEWKVIPLHLMKLVLGKNFEFHSNLDISASLLKNDPTLYQEISRSWRKNLASPDYCSFSNDLSFFGLTHINIVWKSLCVTISSYKN